MSTQPLAQPPVNMETLYHVLHRLVAILKEESAALSRMKIGVMSAYLEEKNQLAAYVETCRAAFQANPQLLRQMQAKERQALKSLHAEFERETHHHQRQLLKVRKVHVLLMGMVQKSMRKKLSSGSGYTKTGGMDEATLNEACIPPFSLNQSF